MVHSSSTSDNLFGKPTSSKENRMKRNLTKETGTCSSDDIDSLSDIENEEEDADSKDGKVTGV